MWLDFIMTGTKNTIIYYFDVRQNIIQSPQKANPNENTFVMTLSWGPIFRTDKRPTHANYLVGPLVKPSTNLWHNFIVILAHLTLALQSHCPPQYCKLIAKKKVKMSLSLLLFLSMDSVVLGDSSSRFTSTRIPVVDWQNLESFGIPARSLIRFHNNMNLNNIAG